MVHISLMEKFRQEAGDVGSNPVYATKTTRYIL